MTRQNLCKVSWMCWHENQYHDSTQNTDTCIASYLTLHTLAYLHLGREELERILRSLQWSLSESNWKAEAIFPTNEILFYFYFYFFLPRTGVSELELIWLAYPHMRAHKPWRYPGQLSVYQIQRSAPPAAPQDCPSPIINFVILLWMLLLLLLLIAAIAIVLVTWLQK